MMTSRRIVLGLAVVAVGLHAGNALAQSGDIFVQGRVTRADDSPAAGVAVALRRQGEEPEYEYRTETDSQGTYFFPAIPQGPRYTLSVRRASGEKLSCTADLTNAPFAEIEIEEIHLGQRREETCELGVTELDLLRIGELSDQEMKVLLLDSGRTDTLTIVLVSSVDPIREVKQIDTVRDTVHDTVRVYVVVERPDTNGPVPPPGWRLGVGGGGASSLVGGMSFAVPALLVNGRNDDGVSITLMGGWFPLDASGDDPLFPDDPRPQFRKRAEAIASLSVSVYPSNDWYGLAFGAIGAWKTVRESDLYLQRAYGLTTGGRIRSRDRDFVFGLDLQFSNLSEFGRSGSRWAIGLVPSFTLSYYFR